LARVVEEEGYGGAFFETADAQSLADAIASLINNPVLRKQYEDQNYAAAKGLPMSELADWYLSHGKKIMQPKFIQSDNYVETLHTAIA
jgi:glycosyltransferase involved in cell wall biosynthesis